jgi:hypothetical protein
MFGNINYIITWKGQQKRGGVGGYLSADFCSFVGVMSEVEKVANFISL